MGKAAQQLTKACIKSETEVSGYTILHSSLSISPRSAPYDNRVHFDQQLT